MGRYTHIIVGLVVTYWILGLAIVFGLIFFPPQPLVDRIEAADSTAVSRDLMNFFEHTPRVEAVLELEQEKGYPDDEREHDRVRYGAGHLLLLAAMIIDLVLIAIVTWIGARRGVFDDEGSVSTRRRAIGRVRGGRAVGGRVSVKSTVIFLAALALGILGLMYSGFWIHSRYGHPTDNAFAFVYPLHLVLTVLIVTAIALSPSRGRSRG